jgi:hypothetical protein
MVICEKFLHSIVKIKTKEYSNIDTTWQTWGALNKLFVLSSVLRK